jgi:hypothetical protein
MSNKEKHFEFISSENYKHQVDVWYKVYNISREKTELFHDFLMSLYELIDTTYLGSDVIITEENQKSHFDWCWNKTIINFTKEKIFFKEKGSHYQYLWTFFYEAYYFNKSEDEDVKIPEYFYKLFDFNYQKSRSELDILTEFYKILEQNLKTIN